MNYSKILVPLDGSKLAEAVLPYVRFLADALRLSVELIHVHDPETVWPSMHLSRAEDYLRQVATSFFTDLTMSCSVQSGAAAAVILDAAATDGGTLVAMATHGQTGGGRWLLGRVAQKVAQAAKNPLILIRPREDSAPSLDLRVRTLIVPLDGSLLAEQIFPHVAYLATKLSLPVLLIRAYSMPSAGYYLAAHIAPPDLAELRAKTEKEVAEYLQAKIEDLKRAGVEKITFVVAEGRGPEEIIELARKTPGSMVAMSSHGRSGMSRWVLGSVADRVVSNCGEPVLLIRPGSPQI